MLRRIRNLLGGRLFGRLYHQGRRIDHSLAKIKVFNNGWNYREQLVLWFQGRPHEHFGPKSRLPDLFQRRDWAYFCLEIQKLPQYKPPPPFHHDLLDAASRVGVVEDIIGYTFKNKMTCIQALKISGDISPLYFKGVIHQMGRNNRLALIGDRILCLALCEIWFATGRSTLDYSSMRVDVETRSALSDKGRFLNLDKRILVSNMSPGPTNDDVAETVEAILGAVYVDSGHQKEAVQKVIQKIRLDRHKNLTMDNDTISTTKVHENSHTQQSMRPLARQSSERLPSKTTAGANVELTKANSHSFVSATARNSTNLFADFFTSHARNSGQENILREGAEPTKASKLSNATKPIPDKSPGSVMHPPVKLAQVLSTSQAGTKIEPKSCFQPESKEATTTTMMPATLTQQVTEDSLQVEINYKYSGTQALATIAKARKEAIIKTNELVARMRKNGDKRATYERIYPAIWRKMQAKIMHDLKEDRRRRMKESKEKERVALEAQKKAADAAAKQKAKEDLARKQVARASAQQKVVEALAAQKQAKATPTAQQKTKEASAMQKQEETPKAQKKVDEASKTQIKVDETSTTRMKQDKSSTTKGRKVVEMSTMQMNLENSAVNEEQAKKSANSQMKVEEASSSLSTKEKDGESTTSKNPATLKSQKEPKSAAHKERTTEETTKPKNSIVAEGSSNIPKTAIDASTNAISEESARTDDQDHSLSLLSQNQSVLQDPEAPGLKTDTTASFFKPKVENSLPYTPLCSLLQSIDEARSDEHLKTSSPTYNGQKIKGVELDEFDEQTAEQLQNDTDSSLITEPELDNTDQNRNMQPEDSFINLSEEDSEPASASSHVFEKSRIQQDLENPASQADTEPTINSSGVDNTIVEGTENEESNSNKPADTDDSQQAQEDPSGRLPAVDVDSEVHVAEGHKE